MFPTANIVIKNKTPNIFRSFTKNFRNSVYLLVFQRFTRIACRPGAAGYTGKSLIDSEIAATGYSSTRPS